MITPDTKDWTWVLERPCPECGFDATRVTDIPGQIRVNVASWRAVVHHNARPDDHTWSPLEYACHVRDVCVLFLTRLDLMLTHENPGFDNWDQDETAVSGRYAEQDPDAVADQLEAAGARLAAAFDRVTGPQWSRPGRRSDGAVFTVDSFARYLLHDLVHHHWDVTGERATGAAG